MTFSFFSGLSQNPTKQVLAMHAYLIIVKIAKKNSKKNGSKRAKISVFWSKIVDCFLNGIGGYTPPPKRKIIVLKKA